MVRVDGNKCRGCGACVNVCPRKAIILIKNIARIDVNKCTECGRCVNVCPAGAISFSLSESDLNFSTPSVPFLAGRNSFGGRGGFGRGKRGGKGQKGRFSR